jgi:hypothetical protein
VAKQHRSSKNPGDRSVPARRDEQGRPEPAQPNSDEQSGSTGRRTNTGELGPTADTGQGRYGQSGFGGKEGRETMGQSRYRQSGPDGGKEADSESNQGSGRPDVDSQGGDPAKPGLRKR